MKDFAVVLLVAVILTSCYFFMEKGYDEGNVAFGHFIVLALGIAAIKGEDINDLFN